MILTLLIKEHIEKADQCLKEIGLEKIRDKKYYSLSDGQKKIVIPLTTPDRKGMKKVISVG